MEYVPLLLIHPSKSTLLAVVELLLLTTRDGDYTYLHSY